MAGALQTFSPSSPIAILPALLDFVQRVPTPGCFALFSHRIAVHPKARFVSICSIREHWTPQANFTLLSVLPIVVTRLESNLKFRGQASSELRLGLDQRP